MSLNLNKRVGYKWDAHWSLFFGVAIWRLWDWRNRCIFDCNFVKPCDPGLVIAITWTKFVSVEGYVCNTDLRGDDRRLGWEKSPQGWLKLNVDGASTLQSAKAGCGGVIRDWVGSWR